MKETDTLSDLTDKVNALEDICTQLLQEDRVEEAMEFLAELDDINEFIEKLEKELQ